MDSKKLKIKIRIYSNIIIHALKLIILKAWKKLESNILLKSRRQKIKSENKNY